MQATQIFLIFLAAFVAFGLSVVQYFYKEKVRTKMFWVLISLRSLGFFVLLLLLLNPKIKNTSYYSEKPNLLLLVDNSVSVKLTDSAARIKSFIDEIKTDPSIKENFELKVFLFGEDLSETDSLTFDEGQTNISGALNSLGKLHKNSLSPTVLITDGNQTYGEDFRVTSSRYGNAIFPVLVGDTVSYQDLSIRQVNVNKYAFLENKFPVEIIVNYSGKEEVQPTLELRSTDKVLYSHTIELNEDKNSEIIEVFLPASAIGAKNYEARLLPLEGEKNIQNNSTDFVVEVIDERARILVLSDLMHPDLGGLKRSVESNEQRQVEIHSVSNNIPDLRNYELVILYQPSEKFEAVFQLLEKENRGYWLITGPETNWNLVNRSQNFFKKEHSAAAENYFAEFNPEYSHFQFKNIGFSEMPPLRDNFGSLETNTLEPLLLQKRNGTRGSPLLGTVEDGPKKYAFLFGEGLWKWRSQIYLHHKSHDLFDDFIGSLIQFLVSQRQKERLSISYEALYEGHERRVLTAQYFDRNFKFDARGKLNLELVNYQTQETHSFPLILTGNKYEVDLGMLEPSEYNFTVSVSGENISKGGEFRIKEGTIEEQFPTANYEGLQVMAEERNQPLYFLKDSQKLVSSLLEENTFVPVQKSRENVVPLVEWYFLLLLFIMSVSLEWFLRKYHGLI